MMSRVETIYVCGVMIRSLHGENKLRDERIVGKIG